MRFLSTFLFIISSLAFADGASQPRVIRANAPLSLDCDYLLSLHPESLAEILPSFREAHSPKTTVEVKTNEIDDQCNIGFCWIYGTSAHMEDELLLESNKSVNLSEEYLGIKALEVRVEDALKAPGQEIIDGGWYPAAIWLADRFGLIPEDQYKPRVNFIKGRAPEKLLHDLNAFVAQYHEHTAALEQQIQIKNMMIASANNVEVLTQPKPDSEMQKQLSQLRKVATEELNALNAELLTAYGIARKNAFDLIKVYSGEIPVSFVVNGKTYTPLTYRQEFFKPTQTTVSITNNPKKLAKKLTDLANTQKSIQIPTVNSLPYKTDVSLVAPPELIERFVTNRLKAGHSVVVSLEMNRVYIDKDSGIMSIAAFPGVTGLEPISTSYRRAFGQLFGGHLVEIVGVQYDAQGNFIYYKIKNSWGTERGDKGFYYVYKDYADLYLKQVYAQLDQAEIDALTTPPRK